MSHLESQHLDKENINRSTNLLTPLINKTWKFDSRKKTLNRFSRTNQMKRRTQWVIIVFHCYWHQVPGPRYQVSGYQYISVSTQSKKTTVENKNQSCLVVLSRSSKYSTMMIPLLFPQVWIIHARRGRESLMTYR